MTVLRLLRLHRPADFADWYRIGAEYVHDVAAGLGLRVGDFESRVVRATDAMRAGRTDLPPDLARSVAADLLADATFCDPFCQWMPLWYELGLAAPCSYTDFQLRRVAKQYATDLPHLSVPRFSRPEDVYIDGRPATAYVDGFADQFTLAAAVLHLEWFVYVARESGIFVPPLFVERTREQTVAYYTGRRSDLDPDVRTFQRLLFSDDEWVRRIADVYDLDSALFDLWARILERERRALS
ncbi:MULTISPECIES: hypothetical protein [Haloferax]|uniref:DUF8116 domain-containing protein n=1 Tax=Haloferax mediterranei (strain ATCC 33500 / DSM 1411 / JCM 8866 / NBRC 14739 / NCIMB 2177 / R-4) TaxID=523841 RepID=I3R250_HALMT|nr:hypothetical protein [Haloferax mediterranei]AFK18310.2 hypothetical protein HFX_0585 [Haloferax mediterranei ATCC 33500]AHZ22292.1 hypothetical protein BM92_06335 [Haloferax mediterranei ATCC 33500]MDX5988398.1 hypothetical protein [Haloferax mediterranei ATCC 33500]